MFASLLATWIRFALIIPSAWVTGLVVKGRPGQLLRTT
jgi:hypothetical protein